MNAKQLIATIAMFAAAGPVFAASGEILGQPTFVSAKTRAEVRAELEQAYKQGQLMGTGEAAYLYANDAPNKSRDGMHRETIAQSPKANKSGK